MTLARRGFRKLREVGWLYFAVTLLERLVPARMLRIARYRVLELRLPREPEVPREAAPLEPRWASEADVRLLTGFGHPVERIRARLERGDRAILTARGGALQASIWFAHGHHDEEDVGVRIRLAPAEVWLFDAMVAPEARGGGLYPKLLARAADDLAREGVERILVAVESLNRNSLRAHVRAGASPVAVLACLRVLGFAFARAGSGWRMARPGRDPLEVTTRELAGP